MGTKIFDLVTLVFDLLIENFTLGYIFWFVGIRALLFHMIVPCDKTFPWLMIIFCNDSIVMEQVIWRCDLSIWPIFQKP
jgi:hypothetical protein